MLSVGAVPCISSLVVHLAPADFADHTHDGVTETPIDASQPTGRYCRNPLRRGMRSRCSHRGSFCRLIIGPTLLNASCAPTSAQDRWMTADQGRSLDPR